MMAEPMSPLRRLFSVLLLVTLGVAAIEGARAESGRLPLLRNDVGGPPIARWRFHVKVLEALPEARKPAFIVTYGKRAQLEPGEIVILIMALRGADLGSAARLAGVPSRVQELEETLRREQRAGELTATDTGPATRIVVVWPPPGHSSKPPRKAR